MLFCCCFSGQRQSYQEKGGESQNSKVRQFCGVGGVWWLLTVMRIIKLKIFPVPVRLHSGYVKLIFVIISPFFAIFKKVVHSLEPGETPSHSASHQAPNYAQRS